MARVLALVFTVFAAFGVTAIAQEPETQAKNDLSGVYLCEGHNPDGSPYTGIVEIAAVGETYLVHWTLPDSEVMGVGIRRGDTLSVSYFGGTPALAVYKSDGDRLDGEWTMGGAEGAVFSEILTRMPDIKAPTPHPVPASPRRTRPVAGVKIA
jgi:hypothetical protein